MDGEIKSRTYSISLGVKSSVQETVQHCQSGITLGQKLSENTGLLGNIGPDANSDITSPCNLENASNLNNFWPAPTLQGRIANYVISAHTP